MDKYAIFYMFENPRRGMQARNFATNVPKILDLKSSSEQIFFRKLSLSAPVFLVFPRIQSVIILDNRCHVDEILNVMSYYATGDFAKL